jgi:hypothetical protein
MSAERRTVPGLTGTGAGSRGQPSHVSSLRTTAVVPSARGMPTVPPGVDRICRTTSAAMTFTRSSTSRRLSDAVSTIDLLAAPVGPNLLSRYGYRRSACLAGSRRSGGGGRRDLPNEVLVESIVACRCARVRPAPTHAKPTSQAGTYPDNRLQLYNGVFADFSASGYA